MSLYTKQMHHLPHDIMTDIAEFLDSYSVESFLMSHRIPSEQYIRNKLDERPMNRVYLTHEGIRRVHLQQQCPATLKKPIKKRVVRTVTQCGGGDQEVGTHDDATNKLGVSNFQVHGNFETIQVIIASDVFERCDKSQMTTSYPFEWMNETQVFPLSIYNKLNVIISPPSDGVYVTYDIVELENKEDEYIWGTWSHILMPVRHRRIYLHSKIASIRLSFPVPCHDVSLVFDGNQRLKLQRENSFTWFTTFKPSIYFSSAMKCELQYQAEKEIIEDIQMYAMYHRILHVKRDAVGIVTHLW